MSSKAPVWLPCFFLFLCFGFVSCWDLVVRSRGAKMALTDKSLPGSTVYMYFLDFAASELAKIDLVITFHRESSSCGRGWKGTADRNFFVQ